MSNESCAKCGAWASGATLCPRCEKEALGRALLSTPRFQAGDLIQGGVYKKYQGRVIGVEGELYKIYWIDNPEQISQFAYWHTNLIDEYYEKKESAS